MDERVIKAHLRYGAAAQHIVMAAGLNKTDGGDDFGEITDENYLLNKFKRKKTIAHGGQHATDGDGSHIVDGANVNRCHSQEYSPNRIEESYSNY